MAVATPYPLTTTRLMSLLFASSSAEVTKGWGELAVIIDVRPEV